MKTDCKACAAVAGKLSLTNVPRVYESNLWVVEHTHPSAVVGWIVLVLKRHCSALHGLTVDEFIEMSSLLRLITLAMHDELHCEKEYVMQFAEAEGYDHVHFHLVARMPEWAAEFRGAKAFAAIGENVERPVTSEQVIRFTSRLSAAIRLELNNEQKSLLS